MIGAYLLISFGIGILAIIKYRSFIGWFFLSLLITPLVAGVILLVLGDNNYSICPKCKEKVKPEAVICKHCGCEFEN